MTDHSSPGMSILCTLEGTDTQIEIRIPFVVAIDHRSVICAASVPVFFTVKGPKRTSSPALTRAVFDARKAGGR